MTRKAFEPVSTFRETKRNLPHMQEPGSTYFITFRTRGHLLDERARKIVLDACLFWDGRKYELHAAAILPDHVHLLLTPLPTFKSRGYHNLSDILHSLKGYSARRINQVVGRKGPLWLDESYDRIVRDEKEFLEKWNYIRDNIVKEGLAPSWEDYAFYYEALP